MGGCSSHRQFVGVGGRQWISMGLIARTHFRESRIHARGAGSIWHPLDKHHLRGERRQALQHGERRRAGSRGL